MSQGVTFVYKMPLFRVTIAVKSNVVHTKKYGTNIHKLNPSHIGRDDERVHFNIFPWEPKDAPSPLISAIAGSRLCCALTMVISKH